MTENVTRNADSPWTLGAVRKLEELWTASTPVALIAQALGRSEAEVGAKASELKLKRPPGASATSH
jgi:hypothetical protein